jgi:hypothetical protein
VEGVEEVEEDVQGEEEEEEDENEDEDEDEREMKEAAAKRLRQTSAKKNTAESRRSAAPLHSSSEIRKQGATRSEQGFKTPSRPLKAPRHQRDDDAGRAGGHEEEEGVGGREERRAASVRKKEEQEAGGGASRPDKKQPNRQALGAPATGTLILLCMRV